MVDRAQVVPGPGQFSQRSDQNPGQPVRVPTGLPYGQRKQLEQVQSAVPLPSSSGVSGQPGRPPSAGGPTGPTPGPSQPIPPNLLGILSHPTQRPNEPITTPSSISAPGTLASLINQARQTTQSSDLEYLANFVNAGRE